MAKGAPGRVEQRAYEIVWEAEIVRGWQPGRRLSQTQQRAEGCDFFSTPPDGGEPHPVEVKGWGDPLKDANGNVTWCVDVRVEQVERAQRDPNWRLEIVATLTQVEAGEGEPECQTLAAADVVDRAQPWIYRVPL